MSLLLSSVPMPAPPVSQAIVVWPRNPFHPADKDLYSVQPGSTVADWMRAQAITEFPLPTVCLVNGQPLLRRDWAIRPLAAHDVVVLVGLPGGGGGGGGSNPLRVEFFNPKTWKPSEVTVSLPGSTKANPATVNLFGCTSQTQAMREGKYIAAANRYRRRLITFRTEMEGLIPTFGDLIAISHDMPAQGIEDSAAGQSADVPWSQLARVMAIRPRGEQVEIACVVEHPLVHTADQ